MKGRRVFVITTEESSPFSGTRKVDGGRFCFLRDYLCDSSVTPHSLASFLYDRGVHGSRHWARLLLRFVFDNC